MLQAQLRGGLSASAERRLSKLATEPFGQLGSPLEVSVDLLLVVPVIGEGGVDLPQGEVGQLIAELFGAEAVRLDLGDELNDFGVGPPRSRDTRGRPELCAGRRFQLRPSRILLRLTAPKCTTAQNRCGSCKTRPPWQHAENEALQGLLTLLCPAYVLCRPRR